MKAGGKNKRVNYTVVVAFLVIGSALLAGAWWHYTSQSRFLTRARRTTGTVVQSGFETGPRNRPVVVTTYEYSVEGQTHQVRLQGSRQHEVGETITLLYDPEAPRECRAEVMRDISRNTALAPAVAGLFFFLSGAYLGIRGWWLTRLIARRLRIPSVVVRMAAEEALRLQGKPCPKSMKRSKFTVPVLKAQHQSTGQELFFFFKPSNSDRVNARRVAHARMPVYVEPDDFEKYFIDENELAEL